MPDLSPTVEINKEKNWLLFNLALANSSRKAAWVEECVVQLSEFDGVPSEGFEATCKGVLRIREFVEGGDTLRTGLCQTVYDAAGRPQDEYSFIISGTLKYKYSIDDVWHSHPLPPRRVKMHGLNPIEVRKTRKLPATNAGDSKRWRDMGSIAALTIVSGVFFNALDLQRVAFATSIFLLLVFAAARRCGILASWVTLATAALMLCVLLPPVHSLRVTAPQDQMLLVFFMLCGALGGRFFGQNQSV
jgi:hypothetical protein